VAQYGDSSGIGAGLLGGVGNNGNIGNGNSGNSAPNFFRDGRDGDIRGLWSFGVNGFFIPPPDFAGLPFLATNGTIIPTSAVGVICFDGIGGCSVELTAVVGGNLGRQVFNVSINKMRFISNLCRVRVSRLGRVILTAKFTEPSSHLFPAASLSVPIVIILQLASRQLAFIEFDQFLVLQGQSIRIRRFDNLFTQGGTNNGWTTSPNGPAISGPGSSPSGTGGNGWVMGGGANNGGTGNGNNDNSVCPNLLDDQSSDGNSGWNGGSGSAHSGSGRGNYGSGSGHDDNSGSTYDGW